MNRKEHKWESAGTPGHGSVKRLNFLENPCPSKPGHIRDTATGATTGPSAAGDDLVAMLADLIEQHGAAAFRLAVRDARRLIADRKKAAPRRRGTSEARRAAKDRRDALLVALCRQLYKNEPKSYAAGVIAQKFARYFAVHWKVDRLAGSCSSPDHHSQTFFAALQIDERVLSVGTLQNLFSRKSPTQMRTGDFSVSS